MNNTNPKVDNYFIDGCGRCSLAATPQCKVNNWHEELIRLRNIILDCDLTEELKWGMPCYTYQKSNIVILAAFKEYCALNFLKGALLEDPEGLLTQPGENSQSARQFRFTSVQQIENKKDWVKTFLFEAIEAEKAGRKVIFKNPEEYTIPVEFQIKLDEFPALKSAFQTLTPGRQRAYLLYFSAPKQAKTRESRIDKCIPLILEGKGLND